MEESCIGIHSVCIYVANVARCQTRFPTYISRDGYILELCDHLRSFCILRANMSLSPS
jgi:hypothetical protein